MTSQEIIEEFSELIQEMASYAYYKIPKPTVLTADDFYQEGCIRAVEVLQRWFDPTKGASARTYVYRALCSKFTDLIEKSCQHVNKKPLMFEEDGEEFTPEYIPDSPIPLPEQVAILEEKFSLLSTLEQQYIDMLLNHAQTNSISQRAIVRKKLGISFQEENELKNKIYEKILS